MLRLLLTVVLLYVVSSQDVQTTTHAHHHHSRTPNPDVESNEREQFHFTYEGHTHQMVITHEHKCYIVSLSDSERVAVHTDVGLRTLELKLLGMLSTAAMTEVQKTDLQQTLPHACGAGHITNYYELSA